jgi:hypothetical protein
LRVKGRLKIATWNARGLGAKVTELDKDLKEKKVNSPIITEPKKKLKGTKYLENC